MLCREVQRNAYAWLHPPLPYLDSHLCKWSQLHVGLAILVIAILDHCPSLNVTLSYKTIVVMGTNFNGSSLCWHFACSYCVIHHISLINPWQNNSSNQYFQHNIHWLHYWNSIFLVIVGNIWNMHNMYLNMLS